MAAFLLRKPLSGLGCKFVYYIQRVARGTALCSTRVLSTYQAFTLSPRRAGWVMLRGRAPRVTGPPCCTCWVLSLLMPIPDPLKTTGPRDSHSSTVPRAAGSAQPQVLSQALSTCGPSLMPCFLPSWSGPVAPWCFSCSDTARGCSTSTPPLGTADAPQRPEPPTPSWCWWSPSSPSTCWITVLFFISVPLQIFVCGCSRSLMSWLLVSPLFPHSCSSWGLLELLGSALELLQWMDKVLNI